MVLSWLLMVIGVLMAVSDDFRCVLMVEMCCG